MKYYTLLTIRKSSVQILLHFVNFPIFCSLKLWPFDWYKFFFLIYVCFLFIFIFTIWMIRYIYMFYRMSHITKMVNFIRLLIIFLIFIYSLIFEKISNSRRWNSQAITIKIYSYEENSKPRWNSSFILLNRL